MPIRVSCPACGRSGRVPDNAVGRLIQCPACTHRYRLTAEMTVPEGLEVLESEAPQAPSPTRPPTSPPRVQPRSGGELRPKPAPQAETYDVEDPYADGYVEPPKWAVKPRLPDKDEDETGGNFNVPLPVMVGGGIGLALLLVLATVGAMKLLGGAGGSPPQAVVSPLALAPGATPVPPSAPAPVPAPAPAPPAAAATPAPAPTPPGTAATPAPTPAPTTTPAAPASPAVPAAPKDAADPEDEDEAELPPGTEDESDVGAKARAAASKAVISDDGGGRTLSTADIVAESEPSVALIKGKLSSGTGFLIAPGLVATNAHVLEVEFVSNLQVRFVSGDAEQKKPIRPELLYEDKDRDLAFLAVKTDLRPLRVAKTYTFRKGEDVTVIGNPGLGDGELILENAISRGVMSTKAKLDKHDFYQLSIAINHGNSGGPVFDSSGRVIGVATRKAAKEEAMGFCIPIEDVQSALTSLPKQSKEQAEHTRSLHRTLRAFEMLRDGGALYSVSADIRRISPDMSNARVKEAVERLENGTKVFDKLVFPSLGPQAIHVKNDKLVAQPVRNKIGEMSQNLTRLRSASLGSKLVGDQELMTMKQTHSRLISEVSKSLNLPIDKDQMVAFENHAANQPQIILGFGSPGGSLRQRMLGQPGFGGPMIRPPGFGTMGPRRLGPRLGH